MNQIPMLSRRFLKEIYSIRIDQNLFEECERCKLMGIDVPELVRRYMREKLPEIRKEIEDRKGA